MDTQFLICVLILASVVTIILFSHVLPPYKISGKLPPGPFPVPILGNILQLGPNPPRSLAKLSKIHGPLMHLKLGSKQAIVVSSPEIAKEVLQKHDQICSGRPVTSVLQVHNHHEASVAWLPTGNRWRRLRKICREQLFAASKLKAGESLRHEKLQDLRNYLEKCSNLGQIVDLSDVVFTTSLNLMFATLFSTDFGCFGSESGREMKEIIVGLCKAAAAPNVGDYFPFLERFDLQGLKRDGEAYVSRLLALLEEIIRERSRTFSGKNSDLLENLLRLNHEDDTSLSRNEIKHLFIDLIVAGSETSTETIVWAMTELLRNPEKMSNLKDELKTVIGQNEQVQESDIPRLPYLCAVVKETFRYHPTAPLLVPHKAEDNAEINGYLVPKDAHIFVNVWAIGRDDKIWPNPDSFEPERFLESKIDYRGKNFELIPFGSGRRMCPGLPLAHRTIHLMLASMVHGFNWKLEEGMKAEELDVNEVFGLTLHRALPLKAFPIKVVINP